MKTITITIIPGGLLIDADDMPGFVISQPESVTEKFFLFTLDQSTSISLN